MRALCYDAKTSGTLPNVVAQIGHKLQDAKNKMSLLYEVNNQTLNVIENLYNTGETVNSTTSSSSNPFAIVGTALPATTANNSIFGQSNTGGSSSNPFASAGSGSLFGGGNTATSVNVFGGTSLSSTANVFGGASSAAPSGGIFGGASAFSTPATSTVFGGVSGTPTAFGGTTAASGGNIFGQPATTAAVSPFTATSNVFGQSALATPATASAFQQNNSVFGGTATFSQPSGIFGGATAAAAGNQSIFGQSAFVNPSNVFGTVAVQPAAQGQSIFGAATPSTQPPQGLFASVFGSVQAVPSQQSIFGAVPASQVAPPPNPFAPAVSSTPFGNSTTQPASATSIFGDSSSYQTFGVPAQQQQTFGSNPFQQATAAQQTRPTDETLFSKLETLTEEALNWFNAEHFELGCIPTCPPPRELCV